MSDELPFSIVGSRIFGNVQRPFKPGDFISLNLSKSSFLAFPGTGMILTVSSPSAQLPDNIYSMPDICKMLDDMLRDDCIIIGQVEPAEPELNPMERVLDSLNKAEGVRSLSAKDWFNDLNKVVSEGTPKIQVLNECMAYELNNKCRDEFITFIDKVMSKIYGPQAIQDTEETKIRIINGGCFVAESDIMLPPTPETTAKLDI